MGSFGGFIFIAFAMIFVIEGLIYALFPDAIRKMMAYAIMMPVHQLRWFGMAMAATGLGMIWLFGNL